MMDVMEMGNEELLVLVKRCFEILRPFRGRELHKRGIHAKDIDALIGAERRCHGSKRLHKARRKTLSVLIPRILDMADR